MPQQEIDEKQPLKHAREAAHGEQLVVEADDKQPPRTQQPGKGDALELKGHTWVSRRGSTAEGEVHVGGAGDPQAARMAQATDPDHPVSEREVDNPLVEALKAVSRIGFAVLVREAAKRIAGDLITSLSEDANDPSSDD